MEWRERRWWARVALALVALSVVVLLAFAGRRGVWLVLLTVGALAVAAAAGFWFLQQRGVLRWLALVLAVGVPGAVLVVFVVERPSCCSVPRCCPRAGPCAPIAPPGSCRWWTPPTLGVRSS